MSGAKYSVNDRLRDRMARDRPRLSDHALEMWDERMPADAVAPETAYAHAIDVTELTALSKWDEKRDRLKLYAGHTADGTHYTAIFIVDQPPGQEEAFSTVVTCYRVRLIDDSALRAYLWVTAREHGFHEEGDR